MDGAEAVHALLEQLLGAFPDLWIQKLALHQADSAVIVEMKFGGAHQRRLGGNRPLWKSDGSAGRRDLD